MINQCKSLSLSSVYMFQPVPVGVRAVVYIPNVTVANVKRIQLTTLEQKFVIVSEYLFNYHRNTQSNWNFK